MRGQTYKFRITRGPFKGQHCRLVSQPLQKPDYAMVKIRGFGDVWLLALDSLAPLNGNGPQGRPRSSKR